MRMIYYEFICEPNESFELPVIVKDKLASENINFYFESYLGYHVHKLCLHSIEEQHKEHFEKILKDNGVSYMIVDLEEESNVLFGKKQSDLKEKLDTDFLLNTEIEIVIDEFIQVVMEGLGDQIILHEEEVARRDKIRIYTHSNEQCGHHIPHVHVEYNNDKNYCVIDLSNYDIIQPKDYSSAKIKSIIPLLKEHIVQARTAWNRTTGMMKFILDNDGNPTDKYIKK